MAKVQFSPTQPSGADHLEQLRLDDPDLYNALVNSPSHKWSYLPDFRSSKFARKFPWRSGVVPTDPQPQHVRPPVSQPSPLLDWRACYLDPFAFNTLANYVQTPQPTLISWDPSGFIRLNNPAQQALQFPLDPTSTGDLRLTAEFEPLDNVAWALSFAAAAPAQIGGGINQAALFTFSPSTPVQPPPRSGSWRACRRLRCIASRPPKLDRCSRPRRVMTTHTGPTPSPQPPC
jgi:hypothetical protein